MKTAKYEQIKTFFGHEPKFQIEAATEVLTYFKNSNYVRLLAEMQAGKTGVCSIISEIALNENIFDTIIFITGESSTALKKQNNDDIESFLRVFNVKDIDKKLQILHRGELRKNNIEKKIKNLNKNQKVLLIIDESHVACGDSGVMSELIKFLKINFFSSSTKKVNNVSVLTVSATPFPESLVEELQDVPSVRLKTTDQYLSVEKMYKSKLIFKSEKAYENDTISSKLLKLLKEFKNSEKEVCVIRSTELSNNKYQLQKSLNGNWFEILVCDQKSEHELSELVENKNNKSKKIIILLKQKGRVGVQLKTSKIDFVWDSPNSTTATTAQSLLGRCCGYGKNNSKVKIFTNLNETLNYIDWRNGKICDLTYTRGKSRVMEVEHYSATLTKKTISELKTDKKWQTTEGKTTLSDRRIHTYKTENGMSGTLIRTFKKLGNKTNVKSVYPLGLQRGGGSMIPNFFVHLKIGNLKLDKKTKKLIEKRRKQGFVGIIYKKLPNKKQINKVTGKNTFYNISVL
jgi:hypothetical protein